MSHPKWTVAAKWRGLLTASVFAWAGSAVIMFVVPVLRSMIIACIIAREYSFDTHPETLLAWFYLLLFYGLPLATFVVASFGFAFWGWAERSGRTNYRSALFTGSTVAVIIVVIEIALTLFFAATSQGTSYTSTYGFRLSENSVPTPLGWSFFAIDAFLTIVLGALTGLTARWAAGKPTRQTSEPSFHHRLNG